METGALEHADRHDPVHRTVFDDEDPCRVRRGRPRRHVRVASADGRRRRLGCRLERQLDVEGAAGTGLAPRADRAAHARDDVLRDREPEAVSAVLPGERDVGLHKRLEHPLDTRFVDADPRVGHLEADRVRRGRRDRDRAAHRSLVGELGRVAEQLPSTWRILMASPRTRRGTPAETVHSNSSPFARASCSGVSAASSTASQRSNSSMSRISSPVSILAISRMSLMIATMCPLERATCSA